MQAQAVTLDSLLNTRVSAAARYAQRVSDAAASITIITAEDLSQRGVRTLAEALGWVSGFHTSDDRNYSYLGVRGFSRPTDYNNRVVLLLNGHPLNEGMYGSAALGGDQAVPLSAVERIEVVRGPASALYGTNSMLAVVNVVTRSGEAVSGAEVGVEAGSAGAWRGAAAAGGRPAGVDVMVAGEWGDVAGADLYFAEYDTPGQNQGVAAGLDWERYWRAVAVARSGGWRVQVRAGDRRKGIPTGAWSSAFNDGRARTGDAYQTVEVRREVRLSPRHAVSGRAALDRYRYVGRYPHADYLSGDETTWRRALLGADWAYDPSPRHRLLLGAEYAEHGRADYYLWREGSAGDRAVTGGDYPFRAGGLFLQHEFAVVEALSLTTGARLDVQSGERATVSPRGGLVWSAAPGTTVKLLYGEAFRSPSAYERFFDNDGFATNPLLRAERIRTAEAVLERRLVRDAVAAATAYVYDMKGLIDVAEVGDTYQFHNAAGARVEGIELSVRGAAREVDGYASYSFQHTHDHAGEELTNAPAHLARVALVWRAGTRVRLGGEAQYDASRLTVQGTRTSGGVVANAHVSVRLPAAFTAELRVRNALDHAYAHPGGYEHVQGAIPQDGRSFAVRLTRRFE